MKVYLDLIFILNFFFDFLILLGVAFILRRRTTFKKILLATLLGLVSLIFFFVNINTFIYLLFKIFICILMVVIAFGFNDIRYTFQNIFYMYTISIVLGGFFYLINLEVDNFLFREHGIIINFLILLLLLPIVLYFYIKQIREIKNNYANYYSIDIYLKDGQIKKMTAFLDTGNKLSDPYLNRPIILVEKSQINISDNENILLVPYDTVNNHGLLECIIPDKLYINNKRIRTKFLIGLSEEKFKIDGIHCILHEKLLERI